MPTLIILLSVDFWDVRVLKKHHAYLLTDKTVTIFSTIVWLHPSETSSPLKCISGSTGLRLGEIEWVSADPPPAMLKKSNKSCIMSDVAKPDLSKEEAPKNLTA
jgi:hypothetical protein